MNEFTAASRTAVLSVFGQFMRGGKRSAVAATLMAVAVAAVTGFGVQEGLMRLSAVGGIGGGPQMQVDAGAKLLVVLMAAAFVLWLLVEFLPRSDWLSMYLRSHEIRRLSRAIVAITRVSIFGGLAALVSGPTLVLSVAGVIGVSASGAALMALVAATIGVSSARIYHVAWARLRRRAARVSRLALSAAEVSVALVAAAVGAGLLWPRAEASGDVLVWAAWQHGWFAVLAIASATGALVASAAFPQLDEQAGAWPRRVLEWRPGGDFRLLRLVARMVTRSRDFRLVLGEVWAMATVGLLMLAAVAYPQRGLVAGHATMVMAAAAGALPLMGGRVIGRRPHLPCLAVPDRSVEALTLGTLAIAGLPVMLVWGVGALMLADWRLSLDVSLALWCGAVGIGSVWWLRWVDGRGLSRAALMGAACAVYGTQVLAAMGLGATGLSERGVAWAIAVGGVGVGLCGAALRGSGLGHTRLSANWSPATDRT